TFFCPSRRRHTRFSRDWSSDVCSSDLALGRPYCTRPHGSVVVGSFAVMASAALLKSAGSIRFPENGARRVRGMPALQAGEANARSEERRGGEEGGSRGARAEKTRKRTL